MEMGTILTPSHTADPEKKEVSNTSLPKRPKKKVINDLYPFFNLYNDQTHD